jgi:hypothetical protein
VATLSQIRTGIAARLATVSGLEVHDNVPGSVNPPAVVITPAPGIFLEYGTTLGNQTNDYTFTLTLFVQRGDEDSGQDALDAYADVSGAQSIPAALDADPTLGGVVHDCNLVDAQNYGRFTYNEVDYFGCTFTLRVMA